MNGMNMNNMNMQNAQGPNMNAMNNINGMTPVTNMNTISNMSNMKMTTGGVGHGSQQPMGTQPPTQFGDPSLHPQPQNMMLAAQPGKISVPPSVTTSAPPNISTPVDPSSTPTSAPPSGAPIPQQPQNVNTGGMNRGGVPSGLGRPAMRATGGATGAAGMQMGMNGSANANAVINYRRHVTNTETLKFLDFCELVGVRSESTKNILYWKKIITEYFSDSGVLRYAVKAGSDSRQFEFSVPIIPRFFFSIIQSGVTRIEIQPGMLRTQVLPNGTTYLESPRCCLIHHYADGSYVNIHGSMKGILNQALRIEWLDFQTHVFIPGVEWPSLEKLLSDESKMIDVLGMLNESNDTSASKSNGVKMEDKSEQRKLEVLQKFRSNFQVFHSMSNFGLQESVMRVMQVSDVMAHLRSLMSFSNTSNTTGPLQALEDFVAKSQKKDGNGGVTPTSKKATGVGANTNSTANGGSNAGPGDANNNNSSQVSQKKSGNTSQNNSPMPDSSPQIRGSKLDISQSTLSKRRRKSTVGDLSPKSLAESPNVGGKATKKTKR
ncbi:Morphogenetic regulator of filamentous growth protein 1 [Cyberlindnera fabianii]|uniref:Morphogenetic regulator of filamentous growth protein 1 n=1 Tax=Cyberlindnera fabianii TaxID=36022 RepID=A0A1V2L829_CYBFA|nr:Morphogenetic regulator of filamentous growth protein 1 [Cyberlindnera fabianii]